MTTIGLATRAVFWIIAFYIVGNAALAALQGGDLVLAVGAVVLFPITFFVYPWIGDLGILFFVGIAAYAISTTAGMQPID